MSRGTLDVPLYPQLSKEKTMLSLLAKDMIIRGDEAELLPSSAVTEVRVLAMLAPLQLLKLPETPHWICMGRCGWRLMKVMRVAELRAEIKTVSSVIFSIRDDAQLEMSPG